MTIRKIFPQARRRLFDRPWQIPAYRYSHVPHKQTRIATAVLALFLVPINASMSQAGRPMEQAPADVLRISASRFHRATLEPAVLDPLKGIGPDEAAVIVLYSNPALRAIRD